MICLTFKTLNEAGFNSSLEKLSNAKLPTKVAYKIMKIKSKIIQEMKHGREIHSKLLKEYAEKDDQGNVKIDDGTRQATIKESKKDEFSKAMEDFFETEVKIDRSKISFAELEKIELTSNDMLNLEPLLDMEGMDEEKIKES